jgi:S-adenosylmethionine synthetase
VSVHLNTAGTAKIAEDKIVALVREHFRLTPLGIIEYLDLRRPIYQKTASGGHFGRSDAEFSWEATNMAAKLRSAAGLSGEPSQPKLAYA